MKISRNKLKQLISEDITVMFSDESNRKMIEASMRKSDVLRDLMLWNMPINESVILKEEIEASIADIAVEENLPAEDEPIVRNHIMTMVQAGLPPVAAYRIVKHVIRGEFMEALKNFPGINILLTPEAIFELVKSGLSMLPENIRTDVVENKYAKATLRLLYSIKEVQKSEDLGTLYDNLKLLVTESSHALIVFAGFLAALSLACLKFGAIITTGGLAVLAAIETASLGIATPVVAGALGVGLAILTFFDTMCLFLGAAAAGTAAAGGGAAVVGFLINKVSKMDPEADLFRDEKFKKEVEDLIGNMSETHKKKFEEVKKQDVPLPPSTGEDVVAEPAVAQITGPVEGEEDEDLDPVGSMRLVAESFDMARWHTLAGVLD